MISRTGGRRADYAELTRKAIIDAARTLFAHNGYFGTKVDEIAKVARVAPGTVYAAGGKQGLLRILVDEWANAPILKQSLDRLPSLTDPHEVLGLVASSSRSVREDHGDVMRVLLAAAPHDETAAEGLRSSTERYRRTLTAVAQHLDALGALHDSVDVQQAADVLWFYFGYSGYFTLTQDTGWSLQDAQQWLLRQCTNALLG
ncbi:TetR/AcrR family transcriptional regulator [Kibdelosporangium phytohabitans]|uniref:TetR family transcriptional regulator n=1 Tax=Kibdelosporangium phytohabitans TaxID=860235 RepID=A0A0N9I769_9PSEU|nr:TetR/AcrR family transcriptional regulator [Kibdelosporangium phytohabitans]ALG10345.1 TetR family transcriptional regulator [Kibdelosporangium phytohabitans]MBE1461390.1 AcrR family transcriptional regulator [Kibdelosporangium phytohabitans]